MLCTYYNFFAMISIFITGNFFYFYIPTDNFPISLFLLYFIKLRFSYLNFVISLPKFRLCKKSNYQRNLSEKNHFQHSQLAHKWLLHLKFTLCENWQTFIGQAQRIMESQLQVSKVPKPLTLSTANLSTLA